MSSLRRGKGRKDWEMKRKIRKERHDAIEIITYLKLAIMKHNEHHQEKITDEQQVSILNYMEDAITTFKIEYYFEGTRLDKCRQQKHTV